MAFASDLTSAEAFQDYVRDYGPDLMTQLFNGSPTLDMLQGIDGMVGDSPEVVMPNVTYTQNIIRAFSPTFAPVATDALSQRVLKAYTLQADIEIRPADYRGSYLAHRAKVERAGGEDPYYVPYAGFIMEGRIAKMRQEIEHAIWMGVRAGTITGGTSTIAQTIDGFVEIMKDEVTATTVAPVTTGALTSTNIIAAIETVYINGLDNPAKAQPVDIFLNVADRAKFIQDYRAKYGNTAGRDNEIVFDLGPATFHFLPYVPVNGILIASKENMYKGFNGVNDWENWRFKEQIKTIEGAVQFNFGVNFGAVNIGGVKVIACNDQFVV